MFGIHTVRCSLSNCRRINLIDFSRRLLLLFVSFFFFIHFSAGGFSASFLLPFAAHLFVSCHFLFFVERYQFVCKIMIRASTHLQYVGNHHRVLYSHFYPLLCIIVIRNGTSKLLFRKLFELKE